MPSAIARCVLAGATAAFLLALSASPARAAFEHARRAGMGDVITARNGMSSQANAAFRALPSPERQPRVIPLPLGLVQLAVSPPVFNPNDPEFSPAKIADLAFSPPYDLRLMSPPSGDDAEIKVRVAEDEIVLDLGAARALVPSPSFEQGTQFAADLISSDVGSATLQISPVLSAHTWMELSDDLAGALADAIPLTSTGSYSLDQTLEASAAMAIGLSYARQVSGERATGLGGGADFLGAEASGAVDEDFDSPMRPSIPSTSESGLRVYVGGGVKYLIGLGYFATDGRLDLIPTEPLLDPDDATDVELAATVRSAVPGGGMAGQGFSVDLGIAALYGDGWEMGLGVTDLYSSMRWRTDVDRVTLDQVSGEIQTTSLARGEDYVTHFTPRVVANVARHWGGGKLTLATDVRHDVDGTSWHVGAETHVSRFALRGGTILDSAQRVQGTGGAGVRLGPVGFDVSLATTSANSAEERALMLGTALVLY